MADAHGPYRDAYARRQKQVVTPYRLGIAVGRAGARLPPPEHYGPKAQRLYQEGIRRGRAERQRNHETIIRALQILDEAHGSGY